MSNPSRQYPLAYVNAFSHFISTFLNTRISNYFPLFILLFLSLPASKAVASPESDWKAGNRFYREKEYDSAAYYFERIATVKPADAAIYYNLGNSYYRLNNIGLAVLNYERALKRKPDYREASDNLLLTQARIPGFIQPAKDIFFVRWWQAATAPGKIMLWAVVSLLLFIGLISLLVFRRLNRGRVFVRPQYIGALTLLWLTGLFLAVSAARSAVDNVRAVVVADNATIPREGNKGVISLPQGTTVTVVSVKGASYEVATPDGRLGILTKSQLAIID